MFPPVPSPRLFPPFVAQHSVRYDQADARLLDRGDLPPSLASAVPRRRLEFLAGRHCARRALALLSPAMAEARLAILADRSPEWPAGLVGSITHAHGFASAAVARSDDALGIGLDSEVVIAPATGREVARSIARGDELARLGAGADERLRLTALFSAKEAIFKCLHRVAGGYFDFLDVELTALDVTGGTFAGRLVRALAERLPAGSLVHGQLAVEGERVHTGVLLRALDSAGARFA